MTEIEVKERIETLSGKELVKQMTAKERMTEADNLIEQAKAASEDLRGQLEEHKRVLDEMKQLKAIELLKGRSEAGVTAQPPKEETPQEYSARIMRGGK